MHQAASRSIGQCHALRPITAQHISGAHSMWQTEEDQAPRTRTQNPIHVADWRGSSPLAPHPKPHSCGKLKRIKPPPHPPPPKTPFMWQIEEDQASGLQPCASAPRNPFMWHIEEDQASGLESCAPTPKTPCGKSFELQ
jgi:hypothetical protein